MIFDPQEEYLTLWMNFDILGWPLACWDDLWSLGMTFHTWLVTSTFGMLEWLWSFRKKIHCQGDLWPICDPVLFDHLTFQANPSIFDDLWHCERPLCDLCPVLDVLPFCNLWYVGDFLYLWCPLRFQWPSNILITFDLSDNFLLFGMTFDHSGWPLTFLHCLWGLPLAFDVLIMTIYLSSPICFQVILFLT